MLSEITKRNPPYTSVARAFSFRLIDIALPELDVDYNGGRGVRGGEIMILGLAIVVAKYPGAYRRRPSRSRFLAFSASA